MASPVLMPQVGQDLTEGELVEWMVKKGDKVAKGDIVALVESEKASFEVEAFASGTVLELLYDVGDMATVLEPLLFLGEPGEVVDSGKGGDKPAAAKEEPAAPQPVQTQAATPTTGRGSSPLARRVAQNAGIDISAIKGTGPRGSVVKRDVEKAITAKGAGAPDPAKGAALAPAAIAAPVQLPGMAAEDREEPFNRMRQVIADRLVQAKQTVPHFYLRSEVDVTDMLIRRRAHLDTGGERTSVNDVIVHAAALTLLEYPRMNAHVGADRVILKGQVNVGVAVSVENGLLVPAIEDTPFKSLTEIGTLVRDYAAAARRGLSKSAARGTFSISNLGMYGVELLPIINPPEAGILGVGPINRKVCEHNGGIAVRDVMPLTLSADHRAVDGAYAAEFLRALGQTLTDYRMFADPAPQRAGR